MHNTFYGQLPHFAGLATVLLEHLWRPMKQKYKGKYNLLLQFLSTEQQIVEMLNYQFKSIIRTKTSSTPESPHSRSTRASCERPLTTCCCTYYSAGVLFRQTEDEIQRLYELTDRACRVPSLRRGSRRYRASERHRAR